jgi:DNA-binding transcriptional regulator YdaS (Cro superfamily)
MKPKDLLSHCGNDHKAAARLAGVTPARVYQWATAEHIPDVRQTYIEVRTSYQLKSDFTLERLGAEENKRCK